MASTPEPRVNFRIRVPSVRLIDQDGAQLGVVPTDEAMRKAQAAHLDLVEVAPMERPPVCRIMDYGKFKYQKKKKQGKHHTVQLKEVRLSPKIQKHDIEIKVKHAKEFLAEGHRVLVTLMFKGREMAHTEIGRQVMARFFEELGTAAKVEKDPQMDKRKLTALLAPAAGKKSGGGAAPAGSPKQPAAAPAPAQQTEVQQEGV